MAGIGRDILVRLRLDSAEMERGLKSVSSRVESFASSVKGRIDWIGTRWFGLESAARRLAITLQQIAGPAMEWEDAQERMRVMARGNTREFDRMRAAVERYSGDLFSKTQIANAYAAGKAVGFVGDQLDEIFPLLLKHADALNVDVNQAMVDFANAIRTGMQRTIANQGVMFTDIELNRRAADMYRTKFSALNDLQQQSVRYASVVEQLARLHGDEAGSVRQASDAVDRLTAAWKDFGAQLVKTGTGQDVLDSITAKIREAEAFTRAQEEKERARQLSRIGPKTGDVIAGLTAEELGYQPTILERVLRKEFEATKDDAEKTGAETYESWLEGITKKAAEQNRLREFMERHLREQMGGALDATFDVRTGTQMGPPAPTPAVAAVQFRLTELDSETTAMRRALQNQAEIEAMVLADRAEAYEGFSGTIITSYGAAVDQMSLGLGMLFSREVRTQKQMGALWRASAKGFSAAMIGAVAEVAAQRGALAVADALAAFPNAAMIASKAAAAAKYFALAGIAGGVASAIQRGADRELAALGQEREPNAGEITRAGGRSSSITGRSDISAMIARAPETVNINVTTILEGPNIIGADAAALRVFYDDHIRQWVADDARSGELAAA